MPTSLKSPLSTAPAHGSYGNGYEHIKSGVQHDLIHHPDLHTTAHGANFTRMVWPRGGETESGAVNINSESWHG